MKCRYALGVFLLLLACSNRNTPRAVAEDFIYNYYQHANQEAALLLSHGLAAEKLEDEIARVQSIRGTDQPVRKMPQIEYKRVGTDATSETENGTHVSFSYQLTIKNRNRMSIHTRKVVITTENIAGNWKVVNFDEY